MSRSRGKGASPSRLPAQVGDRAPSFALPDHEGRPHTLAEHRGQRVVLYFYPADDTPACTAQACDFRSNWRRLVAAGMTVLGVSPDDQESHRRFRRKYRLPFPLLADPDHAVAAAYGAWGEKLLYGRRYVGLIRTTLVIGPDGRITHRFDRVRATGHVARLVSALGL